MSDIPKPPPNHPTWIDYAAAHCDAEQCHNGATNELAALRAEIKSLRDALSHISEYWNRGETDGAMSDALYHMIETADEALKPNAQEAS